VDELNRIVSTFEGTVTDRMEARIGKSSSFASTSFQFEEEHQLTKWRAELSTEQMDTVLAVASAFGLDFYTEEPLPDHERLLQFQNPSVRPTAA